MTRPSTTRDAVVAAINEHGPMTQAELAEQTGLAPRQVKSTISHSRSHFGTQHFYIKGYKLRESGPGREAAIWAVGPGTDAKRPEFDRVLRNKVYRKRTYEKYHALHLLREAKKRGEPINPFWGLMR